MKTTRLLYVIFLFCAIIDLNAQDVIVVKDNSTILSKVIKISGTEIEYKKWSNLDGPIYTIDKSDVLRINYEKGGSDIFENSIIITDGGKMTRNGKYLMLNGRFLTNYEVRNIFGEENYNTYINARRQVNTGSVFMGMLVLSVAWDIVGISRVVSSKTYDEKNTWLDFTYIGAVLTDITAPLAFAFYGIGNGRLKWLVDEYNEKQNNYMSFQLSPCCMNIATPYLQNNYGVGVVISVKF